MHVTSRRGWRGRRPLLAAFAALAVVGVLGITDVASAADDGGVSDAPILGIWEVQSLNGVNNNQFFPTLGAAGQRYLRIGSAHYVDGRSQPFGGPITTVALQGESAEPVPGVPSQPTRYVRAAPT